MALPVLEKTWQFNVNNAIPAGTTYEQTSKSIFNIVQALISFGSNPWVVYSSCNSVLYGNGDGVNHWLSANNIWISSSNCSWIVLRNPITNVQLLIEFKTSDMQTAAFKISLNGNNFTGGTTTTMPTATGSINTGYASWGPSAGIA